MNPLVTELLRKPSRWHKEMAALRTLCLAPGLHESIKWGQACYDLDGRNVVLIHGFKDYCAILFFKGALLKNSAGKLIQQTIHVQAARQLRFVALEEIHAQKTLIAATIAEAIALEKSGAKIEKIPAAQIEFVEEFQSRLKLSAKLSIAFQSLTPGRQRAYLIYFSNAKRSATRSARVDHHAPRILRGLGLHDPD